MALTPDPNNLMLGAGEVLFDRFDAAGLSTGYRHLGNVESLNITSTTEKAEKKSSMEGTRSLLKEAIIGSDAEVTMVLNEYEPENLALAFLGETAAFSQSLEASLVAQPVNGGVAIKFDRWYQLERSTTGAKVKNVSALVVKQGAVTLVLNTDYKVNLELGLVKILEAGAGLEAVTTWEGTAGAVSGTLIKGLASSKIEGRLKYFSAANQAAGPRYEVDVHKVSLAPDGEIGFISEDFGSFTLRGKAQKDTTQPAGQEFFTVRSL